VIAVLGIGEPLFGCLAAVGGSVDVLYIEGGVGVDVDEGGCSAVLREAELKLTELLGAGEGRCGVKSGGVVAEEVSVLEGECVAFSRLNTRRTL